MHSVPNGFRWPPNCPTVRPKQKKPSPDLEIASPDLGKAFPDLDFTSPNSGKRFPDLDASFYDSRSPQFEILPEGNNADQQAI